VRVPVQHEEGVPDLDERADEGRPHGAPRVTYPSGRNRPRARTISSTEKAAPGFSTYRSWAAYATTASGRSQ
jgi:hypothetical protein